MSACIIRDILSSFSLLRQPFMAGWPSAATHRSKQRIA
ncbi:hypothetical protein BRPE64_BCDS12010 [Caballeronia insecticola]|uniref:Uncharacterized protein n=1 Tax=Caballeronia insecticola TaxID=758793 RepID=R4X2W9_9BURK|nr:hypothetical protein BRPE64_BCDS12010 [Caballeronia insecticola]